MYSCGLIHLYILLYNLHACDNVPGQQDNTTIGKLQILILPLMFQ